jgi:hypothetical protein
VDCSVQGVDRAANLVRSKENGRSLGVRLATNKCQGEEVFRVVPVVPLSSTDDSAERVLVGAVDDITSKDSNFQSAEGILVDLDSQFSRET